MHYTLLHYVKVRSAEGCRALSKSQPSGFLISNLARLTTVKLSISAVAEIPNFPPSKQKRVSTKR
ncbi:hypothetical protein F6X95_14380 [Enterococcus durans]|uniref:Uncharacterized protein n=1 Tax=Enterococcus durans TaxID=53345 RepID=A0A5N0YI99_9ENTE|nr:hypothetical protein [Enterococcus faecium]KAA9181994.1 hypothetical protein F6X85_14225 [Enterococcus durans]KAA9178563.1 hypothetical protein F6X79_11700 [Enterococcus faecium]KAA9186836.1 hypothetical protein F6Y12_14580 [Enterococcus durans]KAA9189689.1 hypothetical protein F6X88_14525 [Enterococcus durans]